MKGGSLLKSILCFSLMSSSLLATACGGAAESAGDGTTTAAAIPAAPFTADALLPTNAFLVARIDLAQLRSSPDWDIIEGWVLSVEENIESVLPTLGDGELRRWLGLTDRVWIALVPSGDAQRPGVVTVAEGRFEAAAIDQKLASLGGDRPILVRVPEQPARFRGSWWFEEVTVIEDGLVVATTAGLTDPVRARHEAQVGQSPLSQQVLGQMASRIDFTEHAVSAVANFIPEAKAAFAVGLDPARRSALDAATAGGFRIGLSDGLDGLALLDTTSPQVAAALVTEVEQRRDAVRRNPLVAMMGLAPLLEGLDAVATEGTAQATLRVGAEDTRTVLGRVSSFISLAIVAGISELPRPRPAPTASQSAQGATP
ncbi:MAG: hypothetical protein DRJ42_26770 [Deltaproteobacteria bacterium]|nr:MAG: hypothetical protein DRJ42_26770 [Deltaproteobacteria bacterium]